MWFRGKEVEGWMREVDRETGVLGEELGARSPQTYWGIMRKPPAGEAGL
jgi:hypothetical protein